MSYSRHCIRENVNNQSCDLVNKWGNNELSYCKQFDFKVMHVLFVGHLSKASRHLGNNNYITAFPMVACMLVICVFQL